MNSQWEFWYLCENTCLRKIPAKRMFNLVFCEINRKIWKHFNLHTDFRIHTYKLMHTYAQTRTYNNSNYRRRDHELKRGRSRAPEELKCWGEGWKSYRYSALRQNSQTISNSSDPNLSHSIIYKPNSLQSSSDSSICLLIGRLTRTVAVFVFITNGFF